MFYSHEILTSPEHGVATVWLVATLGSRSITRRFNRKAILEVDVPETCRVIISPEAPMALRLQGNLLYGVSRVYHQQCGYTLLDVQAMHDKMVTMLRLLPGGGLDPSAGKVKPSSLLLPYDPSFLPETNLPGINLDIAFFDISSTDLSSPHSNPWTKSPSDGQSSASHIGSIRLELPSDDAFLGSDLHIAPEGETPTKKRGHGDEEGVLLQPDFEFDEDGNIIEFDPSRLSPRKRRRTSTPQRSEQPTREMDTMNPVEEEDGIRDNDMMDTIMQDNQYVVLPQEQAAAEEQATAPPRRAYQQRVRKTLPTDGSTTLRNTDLANSNSNYLANMAEARRQKQQNKQQTIVKKNADFWVLGSGIGSVGVGLGANDYPHPLSIFSGTELYKSLCGEPEPLETPEETPETKKNQPSPGIGLGLSPPREGGADVEFAREAPASLLDEHSSQMPWNITASLQSSRFRLGSVGDLSMRGDSGSLLTRIRRGRLTSASPLAGRGYLESSDGLGRITGADDELDAREIAAYLEGELATDHEDISVLSRRASVLERAVKQLDLESVNFFEFLAGCVEDGGDKKTLRFSELLPPESTSAAVATQGLMNVLTLATKGLLRVKQEKYEDFGEEAWGERYRYGEILLRMEGV